MLGVAGKAELYRRLGSVLKAVFYGAHGRVALFAIAQSVGGGLHALPEARAQDVQVH